jgi:polygalacturonase
MVGCDDVLIDGIRIINNLRLANCDGIDPDHCKNVRIVNCHIESADDCIVFKNTSYSKKYGACENILVSNCTLISTSAAIKFGTESEAPFRNISIQNCSISNTNRGISIQLRDSGCIENISFSNLNIDTRMFSKAYWWGEAEPIAITAVKRSEDTNVGYVRNIIFSNINCTGENGILLYGDESKNIQNISFDHITLNLVKRTDWPKDNHDLRPCVGNTILKGSLNAVFARNTSCISMEHINVRVSEEIQDYMEQKFDIADCDNFTINNSSYGD